MSKGDGGSRPPRAFQDLGSQRRNRPASRASVPCGTDSRSVPRVPPPGHRSALTGVIFPSSSVSHMTWKLREGPPGPRPPPSAPWWHSGALGQERGDKLLVPFTLRVPLPDTDAQVGGRPSGEGVSQMDTLRKSRNLRRATSTGRSCHGCRHDIKSAVDRARTTGSTPCHRRDSPARRVLCQHPPFTDGETEAQRSGGLPSQEVTGPALGSGSSPSEFTLSLTDPSCPREPSAPHEPPSLLSCRLAGSPAVLGDIPSVRGSVPARCGGPPGMPGRGGCCRGRSGEFSGHLDAPDCDFARTAWEGPAAPGVLPHS